MGPAENRVAGWYLPQSSPPDDLFTATAQTDQWSGMRMMCCYAFMVHPDKKDVRMAITKQHILLGAPIWTSTGLFLIQAGVKIASLTSTGLNSVLKCALDLAVVAQRVKSIGRRLGSSIIFLA